MTDRTEFAAGNAERKSWEAPTIVTHDVLDMTKGGLNNANSPGDDTWYLS